MSVRPMVIVVDDSKPFLMYLSILLNRMNLEVLPVNSMAEALEVASITKPHLLIMDMRMPEMDGLEALKAIRQDKDLSDLPVIMIASYLDKGRHWQAMSLGCIDVLEKPLELRRLHEAIQRSNLYPEGPRRYLRTAFDADIELHHEGRLYKGTSINLSERGIFVHMRELLPKGARVNVDIPLLSGKMLRVGGAVIYTKAQSGNSTVLAQGLAIKFHRLTRADTDVLAELVSDLLAADLPDVGDVVKLTG